MAGPKLMDRDLWKDSFHRSAAPKLPCPTCSKGRLDFDASTLKVEEPTFSKVAANSQDWEPDWTVERFSVFSRCDEKSCGEVVVIIGDTAVVQVMEDPDEWGLIEVLRPRSIFPAPPIISMSEGTPPGIRDEISKAFMLFWSDLNASANRLRVSTELVLDHFKVPTKGLSKKGKVIDLDMNGRIALFNKTAPEHAETLTALRMIGNLGSHGSGVVRDALLDALEVYEDCLSELFGQKKQRMAALKEKLIGSKGKY